jgi:outer membrane protein OmpA-like peptidoglycan-associated protein
MKRRFALLVLGAALAACSSKPAGLRASGRSVTTAVPVVAGGGVPGAALDIPNTVPMKLDIPFTLPLTLRVAGATAKLQIKTCTLVVTLPTDTVGFAFDSSEITNTGRAAIESMLVSFAHAVQIDIVGFTSSEGGYLYNVALSKRRAESVVAVFRSKLPLVPLHADGQGPDHPIADNRTESGRSANRRVVVTAKLTTCAPG